jgi:MFS superfamily sulfate permease-like transporter
VLRVIGPSDPHALAISALVIGVMFLLPLWKKSIPASLVAVVLASAIPYLMGWQLPRVGALPDSFPHPSMGALDFSGFSALLYPAFTLAGLITINQLLTVVVTDRLPDRLNAVRGEVKFNRELVAQGIANMACPFFGAPPGVAMLARTVASAKAGAVSRWSVLAHSFVLLLFLLPMRNLISHIPLVVLAAVTVAVGAQLIGWERFRDLKRMNRADAALFLLTFGLVIFSDLIVGVGIGSLIAMLLFVERAAQSTRLEQLELLEGFVPGPAKQEPSAIFSSSESVKWHPEEQLPLRAEMQMYRLTGPLFFASSEKVLTRLLREVTANTLVLDLTEAGPIDSAATDCLRQLARRQRSRGGELHLIGLDARLFASIEKDGLLNEVGAIVRRDEDAPRYSTGSLLVHPPEHFRRPTPASRDVMRAAPKVRASCQLAADFAMHSIKDPRQAGSLSNPFPRRHVYEQSTTRRSNHNSTFSPLIWPDGSAAGCRDGLAVLWRIKSGNGAAFQNRPNSARRSQDQRQRKPVRPLSRSHRSDHQGYCQRRAV